MTPFEIITALISLFLAAIAFIQYKYFYLWNRKIKSSEILSDLNYGDFANSRDEFIEFVGLESWQKGNYESFKQKASNEDMSKCHLLMEKHLRVFTQIGIDVNKGTIDFNTIFLGLGFTIPRFWEWSEQYIVLLRDATGERHLHLEFQRIAEKIIRQLEKNSERYMKIEQKLERKKLKLTEKIRNRKV